METLDVVEYVRPSLRSRQLLATIRALSLEQAEEACHYVIVATIPCSAHAVDDVMILQELRIFRHPPHLMSSTSIWGPIAPDQEDENGRRKSPVSRL